MTLGQILFLSGIVCFVIAVVFCFVFASKRAKYAPEDIHSEHNDNTTLLKNGYPTDRLTNIYSSNKGNVIIQTEVDAEEATQPFRQQDLEKTEDLSALGAREDRVVLSNDKTELLDVGETEKLQ